MSATKQYKDSDITAEIELPESFKRETEVIKVDFKDKKISNNDKTKDSIPLDKEALLKNLDLEEKHIPETPEKTQLISAQPTLPKLSLELEKKTVDLGLKKSMSHEKDLLDAIKKVSNLKNEMQYFFESHLDEKRKNTQILEKQLEQSFKINENLNDIQQKLKKEIFEITDQIRIFNVEKLELIKLLSELKREVDENKNILEDVEKKRSDLKDLEEKIVIGMERSKEIIVLEERLKHLKQQERSIDISLKEMSHLCDRKNQEKSDLYLKIEQLTLSLESIRIESEKRKDEIISTEKELLSSRERLESIKNEEFLIQKELKNKEHLLSNSKLALSKVESQIEAFNRIHEETSRLYHERKNQQEKELQETEKLILTLKEKEDERQKLQLLQWEKEYHEYRQLKEQELKSELDKRSNDFIESLKNFKKDLSQKLSERVEEKLNNYNFITKEEKQKLIAKEIEHFLSSNLDTLKKKYW